MLKTRSARLKEDSSSRPLKAKHRKRAKSLSNQPRRFPKHKYRQAQEPLAVEVVAPEAAGQAVEISPALIDEIVRRVVTQMSDSVVREIAWEVVPDCVERVIKDMTRQEMSKR